MNLKFKHKQTKDIVSADMLFINEHSDNGTASLQTTLDSILQEYDVILDDLISEITTSANICALTGINDRKFKDMLREDINDALK